LLGVRTRVFKPVTSTGATLIAVPLIALALAQHSPCEAETAYYCVQTEPDPENPQAEMLILDRGYNSDVDPSNPRYLGVSYEQWIGGVISAIGSPRAPLRATFVGGGAFTLARWLEAVRPGSRSNVLEVDGGLVEFDRRHLGLRTSPQLRATVGDARLTMQREPPGSVDVVVGDAFSSRTVPWQLMTKEWLQEVKRALKPHGLYVLNMIDYPPLALLRAEAATLLAGFGNVRMITPLGAGGRPMGNNIVLVASYGALPRQHGAPTGGASVVERAAIARLVGGAKQLRDDYAPVDQLETRPE
ncbi:MAG: fused MFS/spermidine synthase, partial [Solirubrobacteraceae bacterium]